MKVCPECLRMCKDTDQYCPRCRYHLVGLTKSASEEAQKKRKARDIRALLILGAIIVALLLFALFVPSDYQLFPALVERLQGGSGFALTWMDAELFGLPPLAG